MSGFTAPEKLKPSTVIPLPPSAFKDDWQDKPTAVAIVGLRHVPSGTEETARAEAAKYAYMMHPTDADLWSIAYDDALMRWIVAKCTCAPDNAALPFWPMAEDTVRECLTSDGVRLIWGAYERMLIETSPLDPELTDEEVGELVTLLENGTLGIMASSQGKRARRLLKFCLDSLKLVAG